MQSWSQNFPFSWRKWNDFWRLKNFDFYGTYQDWSRYENNSWPMFEAQEIDFYQNILLWTGLNSLWNSKNARAKLNCIEIFQADVGKILSVPSLMRWKTLDWSSCWYDRLESEVISESSIYWKFCIRSLIINIFWSVPFEFDSTKDITKVD